MQPSTNRAPSASPKHLYVHIESDNRFSYHKIFQFGLTVLCLVLILIYGTLGRALVQDVPAAILNSWPFNAALYSTYAIKHLPMVYFSQDVDKFENSFEKTYFNKEDKSDHFWSQNTDDSDYASQPHAFIVAKYHMGCYGYEADLENFRNSEITEAKAIAVESAHSSVFDDSEALYTANLMNAGANTSVCTCMDDMIMPFINTVKYTEEKNGSSMYRAPNEKMDTLSQYLYACYKDDVNVGDNCPEDFPKEQSFDASTDTKKTCYKTARNCGKIYAKVFHQIITQCDKRGMPLNAVKYEGVFNIPTYLTIGLVLLAWSLFYGIVLPESVDLTQKSFGDVKQSSKEDWKPFLMDAFYWLCAFVVFLFSCLGLYDSSGKKLLNMDQADYNSINYKNNPDDRWKGGEGNAVEVIVFIFLLVWFAVETVSVYLNMKFRELQNTKGTLDVIKRAFWVQIRTDVPYIIGFSVLGVSLQVQNNEKDIHNLVYGFILIAVGCFLHHVSAQLRQCYNMIGLFGKAETLYEIQGGMINESNEKTLSFMQFIVWTRVYLAFLVLFITHIFLNDSTASNEHPDIVTSFFGNVIMWFAIAYFLCNVGFDLLFEIVPSYFKGLQMHIRVRNYILLIFLYWILFQHMYWYQQTQFQFTKGTNNKLEFNLAVQTRSS